MANKPTGRGLYIQEDPDADECCENIPPGGTVKAGTSKLKRPHEENEAVFDTCTFSTPAPTSSKPKSRISFQSALTPILQYLNISKKSPETSTHENNRHQTPSLFSFGAATAHCQKSTKGSVQRLNSDPPSSYSGQLFSGMDGPVSFLGDECLPEVTLFDSTCDSTIQLTRNDSPAPDSAPATSASTSPRVNISEIHPPELSEHMTTTDITDPDVKMIDASESKHARVPWLIFDKFLPEITLLDVTRDSPLSPGEQPFSMDVTQDLPPLNLEIDRSLSALSGKTVAQPSSSDVILGEKLPSTSVQSRSCVGESIAKTSLEVTQDITMGSVLENSKSSSEPSECNMETGQTSAEDTLGNNPTNITREIISSIDISAHSNMKCSASQTKVASELQEEPVESSDTLEANNNELITSHETKSASKPSRQNMKMSSTSPDDTFSSQPANITHDITSSSDTSAQSVRSTSNMECSSSQKNIISELVESCHKVNDEDTELKNHVTQPSPKASDSGNGTFNVVQATDLSVCTDLNTTASVSYSQNKTLDLPPFNVSCPKDGTGTSVQAAFGTTETSPITGQNCSSVKECAPFPVQNTNFEKYSLQKCGEDLKNNTFDSEPPSKKNNTITLLETAQSESSQNSSKPNSTITLTEMSSCDGHQSASKPNETMTLSEANSSDGHHNTSKLNGAITVSETSSCDIRPRSSEKPSTPEVSNLTTCLKDNNSEVVPDLSKHNVTTDAKDHSAKEVQTHDDASGGGSCETKDPSGLPVVGGLSDSLNHQSFGTVNHKAKSFNLDDTLDLKADYLITSTPINTERVEGLLLGVQKKLYTDGPGKPADQVPSNLVCDRKTFFKQPAAKSLCLPSKAGVQLMKSKPHSSLPPRLNTVASILPLKRRTQAEGSRNTAATAPDAHQGTTGVTSCYNLRATTTGSKLPTYGLQRSQLSGIPSGIQRATSCLRPPLTRGSMAISSSTDKLCGHAATNTVTKTSQAKKHPLTRAKALPVSKRKKMDASDPCSSVEAPESACDSTNKAKNLKQPSQRPVLAKAQGEGCAKCAKLEEQLKMISEENTRLKEELLKYTKQDDVPAKSQC